MDSPKHSIRQNKFEKTLFDLQFHDIDRQHIKKPDELSINKNKDYPPSTINNDIINRIQGSIFGMAIGDALGAHVEFRPHSYLEVNPVKDLQGGGTWGLEKGQFTDDTSMALCLANSLILCRDFVPYDQLVRYKWWYRYGYMSSTGHCFDIGSATRESIQQFEQRQRIFSQEHQIPVAQMDSLSNLDICSKFNVYCSKDGVAGNGALMRLAPVPLFFYRLPSKGVEYSGISGRITHGDEKAYDACRYYGALIIAALHGTDKKDLISNTFYNDHKEWFGNKILHFDIMNIAQGSYKKNRGYHDGIRGKGYIVNALEAALWAFWSDEDSFEKGVLNAVNLGDDTDTTAAIYGQLAGVYYGYRNLPKKWVEQIYASKFVECLSYWIGYQGENWFNNQKTSEEIDPLSYFPSSTTNETFKSSNPNFHPMNFNRSSSIVSTLNCPMDTIERKAVDPSGRIGYFYDISEDCIIQSSHVNSKIDERHRPAECLLINGDNNQSKNLLQLIGFEDEQRLSLLTNIISPKGIASVMEYPYLIDVNTRILYYSYTIRDEILSLDLKNIEEQSNIDKYVITGISMGIDLILILRLSPLYSNVIDDKLKIIKESLMNNTKLSRNILIDGIICTHIYSNIDHLTKQTTLSDLYYQIEKIKQNFDFYRPSSYILYSIKRFVLNENNIPSTLIQKIEEYFLKFSSINQIWVTNLDNQTLNILEIHFKEELQNVKDQRDKLNQQFQNGKEQIKNAILVIRHGKQLKEIIEKQILNEYLTNPLKGNIEHFILCLTNLKEKVNFINELNKRGFDYQNANKYQIEKNDNQYIIQDNHQQRFICSTDSFNRDYKDKLEHALSTLFNEKKLNPHLQLIYLDFTYSEAEIDQIKVFPSLTYLENINESKSFSQTNNQPINILFIGKSGVGKSTLIKSFSNYINYEDLESYQSILNGIIQFSHFIQNQLEEHIIQLGNDQSMTQDCKSYQFNIPNGTKFSFIDTPGFTQIGDQLKDELIMQRILSFISNLTYLNGICIIVESGDKQLNVYNRYLTQLLNFIGNDANNNIIFCFTKVLNHSINQDHLVKTMLESLQIKNIPFNENNTFRFDLDYLTLSHNEQSWNISKKGWDHLINYLTKNVQPYILYQGFQKREYIKLEIVQLIRPILETIRNNFRNNLLLDTTFSKFQIELRPKSIENHFRICYSCERGCNQYNTFWIMSDSPHEYRNSCYNCSCDSNQHMQIDYRLDYEFLPTRQDHQLDEINIQQKLILISTVTFALFLMETSSNFIDDPFLIHLNRIINEEKYICDNIPSTSMNLALYQQLIQFKQEYQYLINEFSGKGRTADLIYIEDSIETIKRISSVQTQLDVAKHSLEVHQYSGQT